MVPEKAEHKQTIAPELPGTEIDRLQRKVIAKGRHIGGVVAENGAGRLR